MSARLVGKVTVILCLSLVLHGAHAQEPEDTESKLSESRKALDAIHTNTVLRALGVPAIPRAADPMTPAEEQARKVAEALEKVRAFLDTVEKEEAARKGLSATIAFGGTSDESSTNETSKSKVGADLKFGTYPGQLRLNVEASVRDEKNAVKEDVTKIVANYDHYIKPGREVFGFTERFTDSYLDIDQRYEVGLGMKFEWTRKASYERRPFRGDFEDVTFEQFSKEHCEKAYTEAGCKAMADLLEARSKADGSLSTLTELANRDPALKDLLDSLVKQVKGIELRDILTSKRKAATKLELGFAFGALAEFENPAALERNVQILETGDADGDGTANEVLETESRKFGQPSDQRFRLSIRPSLVWRIGQRTEFSLKAYFKPAIDSPRRVDGDLDYRADIYAKFGWKLPTITGKKDSNVIIALSYELHYDNVPPRASPFTLGENEQFAPDALDLVSAKRHRMVELKVEIPL